MLNKFLGLLGYTLVSQASLDDANYWEDVMEDTLESLNIECKTQHEKLRGLLKENQCLREENQDYLDNWESIGKAYKELAKHYQAKQTDLYSYKAEIRQQSQEIDRLVTTIASLSISHIQSLVAAENTIKQLEDSYEKVMLNSYENSKTLKDECKRLQDALTAANVQVHNKTQEVKALSSRYSDIYQFYIKQKVKIASIEKVNRYLRQRL